MRCTCVIRCCACALPMMAARRSRLPAPARLASRRLAARRYSDAGSRARRQTPGKSTQLLPLEQGVPCDISLSLLPEGRSRLHVDLDMIAGDAMSFRLLMEDLTAFYHQCPPVPFHDAPPAYFDHLAQRDADEALRQRRERGQRWWRERLAQVPPAPRLLRTPDRCRSDRLAIQLNAEESRALENVAKRHHTSLSTLFLALFALAVGQGWNMTRFRLNVPLFHRERTGGRASPHRRFL